MMMRLCVMASHAYSPGIVLHQEQQGMTRTIKDCQPYLTSQRAGQDLVTSDSFNLRVNQSEDPWKSFSPLCESNKFLQFDVLARSPAFIDIQETRPDSVLFSCGIAEHCTKQERILKFLTSGSNELERGGLDSSLLSDLMGLEGLLFNDHQQPDSSSLIYPISEFDAPKPVLDFVGDMARNSNFEICPDGHVLFTGSKAEMKDILSIVAEFYLSKSSTKSTQLPLLVPQFSRFNSIEAQAKLHVGSLKIKAVSVMPLKSPEKVRLNRTTKKRNSKKRGTERDLYQRNYFHACESLLSLMTDKSRHRKTAKLSLKKSGPELPALLTQFSAAIAGTGLAVILAVVCKSANGRVAFSASKLLNTGFGFGLVWLSCAVNKLRNTITNNMSKNSVKAGLKEDEMIKRVDISINEIYLRAATILAVAVLRFA